MPLPAVTSPTYELVLPSNNKKIKYRPFFVKEEKILLLAMESEDLNQINNAIFDVLESCIVTKGVKVRNLPIFDIEYLFLNIRGKSIGEAIDLFITCGDDGETEVPLTIFIDEIEVKRNPEHTTDIQLTDKLTVRMKYPSYDQFIQENFDPQNKNDVLDLSFRIIASCIDMVYDSEDCWAASDCTEKEIIEWLETLNPNQYKEIEKFFNTMPKLRYETVIVNPVTEKENLIVLEGLQSFFA